MTNKFYPELFQSVLKMKEGYSEDSSEYKVVKRNLNWTIKEYQGTYKLYASQKALDLANTMKIEKPLSEQTLKTWKKPIEKGGLGDSRNKDGKFYREHLYPISQLIRELMSVDYNNLKEIEKVLSKISIAWITREQQRELDSTAEGRCERGNDPISFCEEKLQDKFIYLKDITKDENFMDEENETRA